MVSIRLLSELLAGTDVKAARCKEQHYNSDINEVRHNRLDSLTAEVGTASVWPVIKITGLGIKNV